MYSSSFFLGLRGTIPELPSSLIADCVIYEPNVCIYWLFVWILLAGITFEKQGVEVPTNCFANCETGSVCSCAKEVNGCNSTVQQQYLPTTATPATTSTLSSTTKQTTTKTTATTKPSTTTTTKPSTTTTQSTTTLTTQETVTTMTSLTTSTMFTSSRTTNNDLVVVPQSTTKISTTIDESSLDFSIPMIVGIIAGGIVLIVLIGIVLFCLYRKSNNANDNDNDNNNVQKIAPPPINSNNEYGSVGLANNTGSTDDTQYSEIRLAPQQYVVGDLTL
jgi:hypothetical protein